MADARGGDRRGGGAEPVDEVAVDRISPPPWRSAVDLADSAYRALRASVRASGVVEPLLLRPAPGGGYEVVSGLRRLQAARQAGEETVPAIIKELADGEAIIESWEAVERSPVTRAERDGLRARLGEAGVSEAVIRRLMAGLHLVGDEGTVEPAPAPAPLEPAPAPAALEPAPAPAALEPEPAPAPAVVEPEPAPAPAAVAPAPGAPASGRGATAADDPATPAGPEPTGGGAGSGAAPHPAGPAPVTGARVTTIELPGPEMDEPDPRSVVAAPGRAAAVEPPPGEATVPDDPGPGGPVERAPHVAGRPAVALGTLLAIWAALFVIIATTLGAQTRPLMVGAGGVAGLGLLILVTGLIRSRRSRRGR